MTQNEKNREDNYVNVVSQTEHNSSST
jgi:hypothetical protein